MTAIELAKKNSNLEDAVEIIDQEALTIKAADVHLECYIAAIKILHGADYIDPAWEQELRKAYAKL